MKDSAGQLFFEKRLSSPDFKKIEMMISQFDSLFSTRVEVGDSLAETTSLLGLLKRKKVDGSKGKAFELGSIEPSLQLPTDFKPIKVPFPYSRMLSGSGVLSAGTFQHKGKTVGYLRIASYGPDSIPSAYFGLKYFIAHLQKKSDYLVVDQMNNPGGAVVFSDMIIKSLTGSLDRSKHMKFAVKPTVDWLARYAQLVVSMQELGFQILTKAEVERFTTLFKEDYRKLEDALRRPDPSNKYHKLGLSEPIDLSLISEFMMLLLDLSLEKTFTSTFPGGFQAYQKITHKLGMDPTVDQVYTKPVYFMINEFDFSGGDATPANLQDYKRVKTIGTRTAGAGGTVNEFSFQNNGMMDFSFRLTTSLMIRSNADRPYVENYGVLPDLIFELKSKDYVSGTSAAFKRMMDMVDEDLNKSSAPTGK